MSHGNGQRTPINRAAYRSALDTDATLAAREALVLSIQRRENLSERVIRALLQVPRHAFVAEGDVLRAYDDGPLSIGFGQTISQPTVVGMMSEALQLRGYETVLEVGAGSGYQAAVLSRLARQVESIETVEPLAAMARAALSKVGYGNARVHVGDGYAGLPDLAPFDAIMVTAAPPEIPTELVQQLRDPGRMVVPVGPYQGVQELLLLEKREGRLIERSLGPVRFVPMVRNRRRG